MAPVNDSASTPRTSSTLHAGAEAIIGKVGTPQAVRMPVTSVAERLSQKFMKVWAQEPQLPEPDALPPAGKSTNCHAPGWNREVRRTVGSVHLAEHRSRAEHLTERQVYGGPRQPWKAIQSQELAREELLGPSDETLRFLRLFLSRARGGGAHRMPQLLRDMKKAADRSDVLSQEEFTNFAMAEGLCRCFYECEKLFWHLSKGDVLPMDHLAALMRGDLEPHREAIVEEVWNSLDPEGHGFIEVPDLLRRFDVRRLPDVRFGREEVQEAQLKLLEGLGVHVDRTHRTHLRRAAGVPCRRTNEEPPQRAVASVEEQIVSWDAWKAYFTTLSVGIMDEEVFEKTLREPLRTYQVHGHLQAQRLITQPVARSNHCNLRVLGTFEDGSRKLLTLRDDSGLEHLAERAGCGDGQFWTWGPNVKQEILQRLQAEGYHNLRTVTLRPM